MLNLNTLYFTSTIEEYLRYNADMDDEIAFITDFTDLHREDGYRGLLTDREYQELKPDLDDPHTHLCLVFNLADWKESHTTKLELNNFNFYIVKIDLNSEYNYKILKGYNEEENKILVSDFVNFLCNTYDINFQVTPRANISFLEVFQILILLSRYLDLPVYFLAQRQWLHGIIDHFNKADLMERINPDIIQFIPKLYGDNILGIRNGDILYDKAMYNHIKDMGFTCKTIK